METNEILVNENTKKENRIATTQNGFSSSLFLYFLNKNHFVNLLLIGLFLT